MARAAHIGRKAALAGADTARAEGVRAIPLKLATLLAPYKKQGRVSLRVERLPQQTRLSLGTRNNDGSWSLTADELDDVEYLVPEGVDGGKALSIRIISLVGGNTLAVLEVPVVPGAGAGQDAAPQRATVNAVDDGQLQHVLDELAQLKTAFAAQESELAEARAAVAHAETDARGAIEAEVAKVRAAAQSEADERLAAAEARGASALQQARAAWDAEEKTRGGDAEARAEATLEAARARWQREAVEDAAKAESAWKAAEAGRLAVAEAQWKEKSAKALTEAGAARDASHASELRGLREALTKAQSTLAERDTALAKASAEHDEARRRAEREAKDALAKAEAEWKTGEAARLAAVEAQWREKFAAATAPRPTEAKTAAPDDSELRAVRAELATAQAALAKAVPARVEEPVAVVDDGELRAARAELTMAQATLAKAVEENAEARARSERAVKDALTKAEAEWKAGEAARLAAAEAEWREMEAAPPPPPPPPASAAAHAAPAAAVDRKHEDELRALRKELAETEAQAHATEEALALARMRAKDEIASLKSTLAKRDEELSRAKSAQNSAPTRGYEAPAQTQTSNIRDFINRPSEKAPDQKSFVWEIVIAVVLGAAGVIFYPMIESFIFGEPPAVTRPAPPLPRPKPELPRPPETTALLTRDAKMRADASPKADVVASLKGGASVVVVETRDAWTNVRAGDKSGWVKSALLNPAVAAVPPANLPPASPPAP